MISDWTIRLCTIYTPDGDFQAQVCVGCFDEHYATDVAATVLEGLNTAAWNGGNPAQLQEWLDGHNLQDVSVLRSLWGSWGLETWLADLRADAFPDSFPVSPMISVEYDGYEEERECLTCEGDGCEQCDDGTTCYGPSCDYCGEEV